MRKLSVICLALLAGCSSGNTTTTTPVRPVTLVLDWYPNPDHVGVYTGIDRGFFRSAGLAVHPVAPTDVSDPIRFVVAGRADLGISYEPEVFFAQQHHLPVVAVAAIVPTALNSIIARGDRGIRTPADLAGKTIGEDGSASTDAYLTAVLRTAGLAPGAVHRVNVGFNLIPALRSGRVDAIIGGFQNIEGVQASVDGLHPVSFPVDHHGVPDYDELVVVASASRLRSDAGYRSMVLRFTASLARATAWAKAHPAAAVAVMKKESYRDYQGQLERSVPATLALLGSPALDPGAWQRFGLWMWRSGLLHSRPDGAALVARP